MQESEAHGVPTWLVMALAVVVPLILATLFGGLPEWSNRIFRVCGVEHGVMPRDRREKQQDRAAAWAGAVDLCRAGWMAPWAQHTGAGGDPAHFHPWSGVVFFFWFFGATMK